MQLRLLAHHQLLVEEDAGGVGRSKTQHVALALGVDAVGTVVLSGSDRLEAEARRAQTDLLARNRGKGGQSKRSARGFSWFPSVPSSTLRAAGRPPARG
jgi:hypothetical protein